MNAGTAEDKTTAAVLCVFSVELESKTKQTWNAALLFRWVGEAGATGETRQLEAGGG